jgi:NodT family efflux transporter outer membrane factor (OMF) lipoprotein
MKMNLSNTFKPRGALTACTLAVLLLATGCASVGTPYSTPAVNAPAQWTYAGTQGAARANADPWWRNFNDPQLTLLVEEALKRNNDLAAATIRVRRAQLQAGLAEDRLTPSFSGGADVRASRALSGSNNGTNRSSGASLGVSYEVDLWNRLGSERDIARWEALATAQDREATALSLIGTTAVLYWQIGYLNQRIAAGQSSIGYARKTLDLVEAQYRAGAVSGLERAQAQQSLASQQASQTQLEQQLVEAKNALALLFDGQFASLPAEATTLPLTLPASTLPPLDAGLPAELLGRRPDLRAAELRLRESVSNIDATRASYYPSLSLTGGLGTSSAALLSLLSNPVLTLGAGISLPFLNRTQMDLDIKVSKAQYEEAVVNFRQTLYAAFGDVENALSARQQFAQQGALLEESLRAAREAERLYEIRYRAGSEPLKSWLDAQERRRSAEISLADNRFNRLSNHATLYQALGGDAVSPVPAVAATR